MSKPQKPVAAPPVPAPEAIPDTSPETGDAEKKAYYKKGRRATFITGDLEPRTTGKKTLLG